MTGKLCRMTIFALGALLLVGSLPVQAQLRAGQQGPDYSKGPGQFPNLLGPYAPIRVAQPVLTNSARVDQLISEGKLQLSLQDAISLTLENNLDISVQRYTPWLAETDLLRQKSGNGFVNFDPRVTSTFNWNRNSSPVNNPLLAGTGTNVTALTAFTSYNTQANFQYQQGFKTGTTMFITQNNSRQSSTSLSNLFNPSVNSFLSFSFSQPLLNGFGISTNTRGLRIAKNNQRIADLTFADQVIRTVSQVQNLYWDLVFAREDVKVKEQSLQLAEKLYNDNKRQVEIGTLAPIEVVRAEAEVARTRQDLIVAQTFLLQMQISVKNAITKNPLDPAIQAVEVVPTDAISQPPQVEVLPVLDAVREAWEKRPDVKQAQLDLDTRGLNVKGTRNALLPSLTLNGQFAGTGLAGNSRSLTINTPVPGTFVSTGTPVVDANGNQISVNGVPAFIGTQATTQTVIPASSGGLGRAYDVMSGFDFPGYGVSFTLTIPILNRAAQADNARAILEQRQSETRLRQLQNSVFVEVRNAQIALEQNRARVDAAIKSRELGERTLDAEQKKYQLGASTIFFVIQAQRDLAQARSAEVGALTALLKARVEFERALGRTLETNKIDISDAKAGDVQRQKLIPGTIANVGERGRF